MGYSFKTCSRCFTWVSVSGTDIFHCAETQLSFYKLELNAEMTRISQALAIIFVGVVLWCLHALNISAVLLKYR